MPVVRRSMCASGSRPAMKISVPTPSSIVGLVVRQGAVITLTGLAIGLTSAYVAVGWISSFLFGISARDPFAFAIVPIVLLAVATLAVFVPARRAARIDPLKAMRGTG